MTYPHDVGSDFQYHQQAREQVRDWYNRFWREQALAHNAQTGEHAIAAQLETRDTYLVWFCKTLQHWKALVSTNLPDNRYFEITYNGDTNEFYVDEYVKQSNIAIPDGPVLDIS